MDEKFLLEYKIFLSFLKKSLNKIDNTNNQIENYISNIMPRAHKKIQINE